MNGQAYIVLKNEFHQTAIEEVRSICESIIWESQSAGEPEESIPQKFFHGLIASNKILDGEPISRAEFHAIGNVIGGYFSSLHLKNKTIKVEGDILAHANELMRFWGAMEQSVDPAWRLEIIKGGKE